MKIQQQKNHTTLDYYFLSKWKNSFRKPLYLVILLPSLDTISPGFRTFWTRVSALANK